MFHLHLVLCTLSEPRMCTCLEALYHRLVKVNNDFPSFILIQHNKRELLSKELFDRLICLWLAVSYTAINLAEFLSYKMAQFITTIAAPPQTLTNCPDDHRFLIEVKSLSRVKIQSVLPEHFDDFVVLFGWHQSEFENLLTTQRQTRTS